MDLMVLDIQRALGIDSAGYLAWNGLCTGHSLYHLVHYRLFRMNFKAVDIQRALGIDSAGYLA